MNKKNRALISLNLIIIFLLMIVTICGICSFNTGYSYEVINQYGDTVRMWGTGLYSHDSYFMAPIFIGSDFTMLVITVPLAIITLVKMRKEESVESYVRNFSILNIILYYSASLAFGVTYNYLHLAYILLFGASFYGVGLLFVKLFAMSYSTNFNYKYSITKGMEIFLILSGISLFVAWLPDIISSLVRGSSLDLIEVYTTSITYVLDMGIISPLMFLTLYLLKKGSFIGYILFRMILKICMIIGIMLPVQSVFQMISGIEIPIPALISKVLIFVMLAFFAAFFENRMKKQLE